MTKGVPVIDFKVFIFPIIYIMLNRFLDTLLFFYKNQ